MKPIKVPYRQTGKYGCGSYSLANLFSNPDITEGVMTEEEVLANLNFKLQEHQSQYFVDPLVIASLDMAMFHRIKTPEVILQDYGIEQEMANELCVPFLVTILRANTALHMMLVVRNLKNDVLHVVDSCSENIVEFTVGDFMHFYHIVGIMRFGAWNNVRLPLILEKGQLPHLFDIYD